MVIPCSLTGADQKADQNAVEVKDVAKDVAATTETVEKVKVKTDQHGTEIKVLKEDVVKQGEAIELIQAELAEARIDIERVDAKVRIECPS